MDATRGPVDPFAGDPHDPARELAALDDAVVEPVPPSDREAVLADLEDLELFEALLAPRGLRGLVVHERYLDWPLLRATLRSVLDAGTPHVHEPAVQADPAAYVSWDYARGFTDAVLAAEDEGDDEDQAEDDEGSA